MIKRLRALIQRQLREGLSPDKLALAIALGVVIGVFPVFGTTTALCVLAATLLRLNQALIQAANYAAYPAFIALMIPFMRAGDWLFGSDGRVLTLSGVRALFNRGFVTFARQLSTELVHGVVAWMIVAPFAVFALRAAALVLIRRYARRTEIQPIAG
ncbi:MAG: DUF2062 domain-containing protein [Gemmatimonadaceae bacterium]